MNECEVNEQSVLPLFVGRILTQRVAHNISMGQGTVSYTTRLRNNSLDWSREERWKKVEVGAVTCALYEILATVKSQFIGSSSSFLSLFFLSFLPSFHKYLLCIFLEQYWCETYKGEQYIISVPKYCQNIYKSTLINL